MKERSEAIVLAEEIPVDAPESAPQPDLRGESGTVYQSRIVVAALQPAGARRGRATKTIRCWKSSAFSRSRPTTSMNSSWSALPPSRAGGRGCRRTRSPDGLTPLEQLGRIAEVVSVAGAATSRRAGANCARNLPGERRRRCRRAGRHQAGACVARGLLPHVDLPGADADGDRSGASVPVHSQSRLHAGAAAFARQRRQGDERGDPYAAQDRALRASAARRQRAASHHAGAGGLSVHRPVVPRATR